MTQTEALRLALEAMEADELAMIQDKEGHMVYLKEHAITAIKAALEAKDDGITLTTIRHPRGKHALGDLNPESLETVEIDLPEPVAWGVFNHNLHDMFFAKEEAHEMVRLKGDGSTVKPLYTAPPQRTWVGLTDDEIEHVRNDQPWWAIRAIEAKLKEKNT